MIWNTAVLLAENDLSILFKNENITGSITVYDLKNNRWIYSDKRDSFIPSLPASTFKIINSLVFLEEKIIRPGQILKWDEIPKTFYGKSVPAWNKDTDIENAFKNSTIWFYLELSKKIPEIAYKKYLTQFHYGNGNLNDYGSDFWNQGEFAVTPRNQIEFLIKLYKDDLPVAKNNLHYVKKIMIDTIGNQSAGDYTIYGKTGWAVKNHAHIGWYVGYSESKNHSCFFATRITAQEKELPTNFAALRKSITHKALEKIGCINNI